MKFFKKCKVMHLGSNDPSHQDAEIHQLAGSSSAEKDLGILMGTRLNKSQKCALASEEAISIHGCFR